jgi:hypothetical protein
MKQTSPCTDKFGTVLKEGNMVEVQELGEPYS